MTAHTQNTIVIDAPFELVWEMTNDVENWPRLYSEYAEAEILERRGDTVRFRLTMHPDENGTSWSWVSERTPDKEAKAVRAHRVEPGPFDYMHIFWKYEPDGDRVRMTWTQDFQMKPQAPIDDAGMKARIDRNSKIQMKLIKERVEEAARNIRHSTR